MVCFCGKIQALLSDFFLFLKKQQLCLSLPNNSGKLRHSLESAGNHASGIQPVPQLILRLLRIDLWKLKKTNKKKPSGLHWSNVGKHWRHKQKYYWKYICEGFHSLRSFKVFRIMLRQMDCFLGCFFFSVSYCFVSHLKGFIWESSIGGKKTGWSEKGSTILSSYETDEGRSSDSPMPTPSQDSPSTSFRTDESFQMRVEMSSRCHKLM